MAHFRANVNHSSCECFKHFDNKERMFKWISEKVGEPITSYDECENWTRNQEDEYIEVIDITDIRKFYELRRKYIGTLQKCDTIFSKAKRLPKSDKRDRMLTEFQSLYESMEHLWGIHPEVWQGEI